MPATDIEHVTSLAFTRALSDIESVLPERLSLVPSCRECNSIAADKVFFNVSSKRRYIHQRIKVRYKKLLRIPPWTDQDLSELSLELAQFVRHGLRLREIILSRLKWRTSSGRVNNVVLPSHRPEIHKSSVEENVVLPSTTRESTSHYVKSKRKICRRVLKICECGCGCKFSPNPSYQRFCSDDCYYTASNRKLKEISEALSRHPGRSEQ
jgi:hypothetical protein